MINSHFDNDHYVWEELKIHQSEASNGESCAQVLFFS